MKRAHTFLIVLLGLVVVTGALTIKTDTANTFWYTLGVLVAGWLTLAIFSFLYQDNPLYKFAEHLYLGIAAGYGVSVTFWETFLPKLWYELFSPSPATTGRALAAWEPDYWLLIPLFFGILFFARFTKKRDYLLRWSLAFLIGGYAGVKLTGYAQGDVVAQAGATMLPLVGPDFFPPFPYLRPNGAVDYGLNNLIFIVGVISTLAYFFFSKPHRGALGGTAKVGIAFLMVAFGASFGYTVMARISLLIGRFLFLLQDWARVVT